MDNNRFIFNFNNPTDTYDYDKLINIENKKSHQLSEEEIDYLLNWINYRISEYLAADDIEYSLKCIYVAELISGLLDRLKIYNNVYFIGSIIGENINFHAITLVNFDYNKDKLYVIDPTFRQFLVKEKCLCDFYPGYFLTQTKEGIEFGENLLNHGFFKLNESNLKIYFDSLIKFKNTHRNIEIETGIKSGKEYYLDLLNAYEHEEIDNIKSFDRLPSEMTRK